MTNSKRRIFLKGTAVGVIAAVGSTLFWPLKALAAQWPKNAFGAKTGAAALKEFYGTDSVADNDAIEIKAPIHIKNGAVVPVSISTTLPNVDSMAIIVQKNPLPFVATMTLIGAAPYISARIKMAKTSEVHGVVRSAGKLYKATQVVKVTVGGCGD